jgi:hypothetical protein
LLVVASATLSIRKSGTLSASTPELLNWRLSSAKIRFRALGLSWPSVAVA